MIEYPRHCPFLVNDPSKKSLTCLFKNSECKDYETGRVLLEKRIQGNVLVCIENKNNNGRIETIDTIILEGSLVEEYIKEEELITKYSDIKFGCGCMYKAISKELKTKLMNYLISKED